MTNTVIFLSNQYVAALEGAVKEKKLTISRVCSAQAPEGSIINGTVTEKEEFDCFFRKFWEKNHLAHRNVTLVLGSAQAVSRQLLIPEMSHAKRMEYLRKEFSEMGRNRDPVLSYVKIGQENGMERMLVNMVNRSFLDDHIRRFDEMKIHLKSVVMASTADLMVFRECACLRGKTCVMQILDGMSVLNILYVDGTYFQMSRHRLLSERGTPAFGMECAACISNLQRFLYTQFPKQEVVQVYLLGEFSDGDFRCCRDCMQDMMPGLKAERLGKEACGRIRFEAAAEAETFDEILAPVGGLLVSGKKNNLLYQYYHDPVMEQSRRQKIRVFAAAASVLMLLGILAAGQTVSWFWNAAAAEKQQELLNRLSESGEAEDYDRIQEELQLLKDQKEQLDRCLEEVWKAPEYRVEARAAVQECAEGCAAAEIASYDGSRGMIVIRLTAEKAEAIHKFAENLRHRQALFEYVTYDGFAWEEEKGGWTADVRAFFR